MNFVLQPSTWVTKHSTPSHLLELRLELDFANAQLIWNRRLSATQKFELRAVDASSSSSGEEQSSQDEEVKSDRISLNLKEPVSKFQGIISSFPPIVFTVIVLSLALFFFFFFFLKLEFLSCMFQNFVFWVTSTLIC